MQRGMTSVALLCSLPYRTARRGDVGGAARARTRSPFSRSAPSCRLPPSSRAGERRAPARDVYDLAIRRGHRRDPARLPDADLRLRRASIPGPTIRARKGREVVVRQRNALSFDVQRAPARRLRARRPTTGTRWTSSRPARRVRLPVPERPGRGDALVPRPRPRPHGAHALLRAWSAIYLLEDDRETELELPRGEYDVPLVIAGPRVQPGRLVPLAARTSTSASAATRSSSTARSLRACACKRRTLPAALPQRLERAHVHAAARPRPADDADRQRRRAARAAGRAHARRAAPGRAGRGVDRLPRLRAGTELVLAQRATATAARWR